MSRPSKMIVPPVGSSSRMMQRAIVDLPQPDSPTTPSVSPRVDGEADAVDRLTAPTCFWKTIPRVTGKCFFEVLDREDSVRHVVFALRGHRRRAASRPSARASPRRGGTLQMVASPVRRHRAAAPPAAEVHNVRAARVERGSPLGGLSNDGGWPGIWTSRSTSAFSRGSEPSRPHVYGMLRLLEEVVDRRLLDDLAPRT